MNEELMTLWALRELDERLVVMLSALSRFPTQRKAIEERLSVDHANLDALKRQLGEFQVRRRQMEKDIEALTAEERGATVRGPLASAARSALGVVGRVIGRLP